MDLKKWKMLLCDFFNQGPLRCPEKELTSLY